MPMDIVCLCVCRVCVCVCVCACVCRVCVRVSCVCACVYVCVCAYTNHLAGSIDKMQALASSKRSLPFHAFSVHN